MGLRDIESTLPPGFRFYPSDEELIRHYLYKKVANETDNEVTMVEVDLHTSELWELPEVAKLSPNEWYFFSFRDRKYATGSRANRATKSGYWKATGKDRTIYDPRAHTTIAGMRKTLVFYRGRAPNGIRTVWVMHEFRLETPRLSPSKEDWVLCRVVNKGKGEAKMDTSPTLMNNAMPHGIYDQDHMDPSLPINNPLQEDPCSLLYLRALLCVSPIRCAESKIKTLDARSSNLQCVCSTRWNTPSPGTGFTKL